MRTVQIIGFCVGISGSQLNARELWSTKSNSFGKSPKLIIQRKSNRVGTKRKLCVRAEYNDGSRGGGGNFFAGFLLGGAVFGTLAYVFAPQIRRSLLNEDEYGFQKAKRPIYYDEGVERTCQTLNEKISQLNSAIDNVWKSLVPHTIPQQMPQLATWRVVAFVVGLCVALAELTMYLHV